MRGYYPDILRDEILKEEQEQEEVMRDAFMKYDTDNSGEIDVTELRQAVQSMGIKLSERDTLALLEQIDPYAVKEKLTFNSFKKFMEFIGSDNASKALGDQARLLRRWDLIASSYLVILLFADLALALLWAAYPSKYFALSVFAGIVNVQVIILIYKLIVAPLIDIKRRKRKARAAELAQEREAVAKIEQEVPKTFKGIQAYRIHHFNRPRDGPIFKVSQERRIEPPIETSHLPAIEDL